MKWMITILIILCASLSLHAQVLWKSVSAGTEFSVGLRTDGTLWSWGANTVGQLGIPNQNQPEYSPVRIGRDSDWWMVDAGSVQCLAIKKNGTLWAWGYNPYGELGVGNFYSQVDSPMQVGTDANWIMISTDYATSYGIKRNGTLWAFGYNYAGEIGNGDTLSQYTPIQIGNDSDWVSVSAGGIHVLALKKDGSLWAWGDNSVGQLGLGDSISKGKVPTRVDSSNDWSAISAGFQFSMALKKDGSLWDWGFNANHELGDSSTSIITRPQQIGTDHDWSKIFAGSAYAFALKKDSTLYGWGFNKFGQLGLGTTTEENVPVKVGSAKWIQIAPATGALAQNTVFGFHTLGIKKGQQQICVTGANYTGQLGNNTTSSKTSFDCSLTINSGITSLNQKAQTVKVFPNPAQNTINIDGLNNGSYYFRLMDITGKTVLMGKLNQENANFETIDFHHIHAGIYLLEIYNENTIRNFRIVKTQE